MIAPGEEVVRVRSKRVESGAGMSRTLLQTARPCQWIGKDYREIFPCASASKRSYSSLPRSCRQNAVQARGRTLNQSWAALQIGTPLDSSVRVAGKVRERTCPGSFGPAHRGCSYMIASTSPGRSQNPKATHGPFAFTASDHALSALCFSRPAADLRTRAGRDVRFRGDPERLMGLFGLGPRRAGLGGALIGLQSPREPRRRPSPAHTATAGAPNHHRPPGHPPHRRERP